MYFQVGIYVSVGDKPKAGLLDDQAESLRRAGNAGYKGRVGMFQLVEAKAVGKTPGMFRELGLVRVGQLK